MKEVRNLRRPAKSATTTIPIVFEMGADPVAIGVVRSLNRPEANLTGVTSLSVEVSQKRFGYLHEVLPKAAAFAVLANPTSPTAVSQLGNLRAVADPAGVQLHVLHASIERELDVVFANLRQLRTDGLVITSDTFLGTQAARLAVLTTGQGVPAIHQSRDFTIAGGLMSFGGSYPETHRRAGVYTGRIIKGEKPGDLPVLQVTKLELFVNLKTAKAMSIDFPPSLLVSVDEFVE